MTCLLRRAALLSLAVVLTACGSSSEPAPVAETSSASPGEVALTPEQITQGGVVVTTLDASTWAEPIEAPAVLQLDEQHTARVGAIVDARVERVRVEVGDAVRRGAILAELHSHITHDAVAALRKAVASSARLQGELAYARSSLGRYERLLPDGAASPQEVERARTTVESLQREIEMSAADEARARAELRHYGIAPDDLARPGPDGHPNDQMPVRSPLDGTVLERLITPGTTVTSGQPLFVVSDLTTLWVTGQVDERWASALATGRTATVRVTAYPDERFEATVTYIGDVVDADTRRITVRATLRNPGRRLKPEMYARLVLAGASREGLVVPDAAIQHVDGRDVVFVERAPGRFAPVEVRTAAHASDDGRVVVLDGVSAGTRVVTEGAFLVRSEFQKALLAEEE